MSTRVVHLISYRQTSRQRAHFAIWVSYAHGTAGTLIHVVGSPMAGYFLEFKRGYDPQATSRRYESFQIGKISSQYVQDWTGGEITDSTARGNLEVVATQIPPPRISENFMAPVNDTTNRRCQEWTMDFVRRLVAIQYIDGSAATIVQSRRDPPTHGIVGLQAGMAVAAAQPQQAPQQHQHQPAPQQHQPAPQQQPQQSQQPQQQPQTHTGVWQWDPKERRYRRLENGQWIWQ